MPEGDDTILIEQARQRAARLLDGLTSDLASLRSAVNNAAYADGIACYEDVAAATRQLIAELDPISPEENPRP